MRKELVYRVRRGPRISPENLKIFQNYLKSVFTISTAFSIGILDVSVLILNCVRNVKKKIACSTIINFPDSCRTFRRQPIIEIFYYRLSMEARVVFHLPKNCGNFGWDVNRTRPFGSFLWKFSGINGISEKVVPFSRWKLPNGKFVFHLQISRL